MSEYIFESSGDLVRCTGENFEYMRCGNLTRFIQKGKVPSIRVVKMIIKNLECLSGVCDEQ